MKQKQQSRNSQHREKKNSERKYSIPTRPPNASRIRVRSSDYWLRYSRQTPQPCSAESEWSRFDDLYGVWRLPFIYICMCVLVLLLSQQQIVTLKYMKNALARGWQACCRCKNIYMGEWSIEIMRGVLRCLLNR